MRFIQTGAQALLALSILISGVVSVPVDGNPRGTEVVTADDAAAAQLSQRDSEVLVATDDALAILNGRDLDDVQLAKRNSPPTAKEFDQFFASHKDQLGLMVFWSGTGQDDADAFARSKGRVTLNILLKDTWREFQSYKAKDSHFHWDTWPQAVAGFWDPLSAAAARASVDEVYVLMSPAYNNEQMGEDNSNKCATCWYRMEKPTLVSRLASGRISKISKWLTPLPGTPAGQVVTMWDKI